MIRIARTLRPARLRQTSQVFFGPGGERGGRRALARAAVRAAHGGPCAAARPLPSCPAAPLRPRHTQTVPRPAPVAGAAQAHRPGAGHPGHRSNKLRPAGPPAPPQRLRPAPAPQLPGPRGARGRA